MQQSAELVEKIEWRGKPLAYLVRSRMEPDRTLFLTPPQFIQQMGFVVHAAGETVRRHTHKPKSLLVTGAPEVLVVRKGRCEIDLYGEEKTLLCTRTLETGDILLIMDGGHGLRMLEDTVLVEVKQGPYGGAADKEMF